MRSDDLVNGTVKSISGGKIKDIKEDLLSLRIKPKIIISQIGGNDLDSDGATVDDTMANYVMALTETKVNFPETKLVIAGLPPRHKSLEILTKVKDYNQSMKQWCETNNMDFVNNEELFEYKTGEVDRSSYIMSGPTPAVHLTRSATLRMLENIQKVVPSMKLFDKRHNEPKSYAQAVATTPRQQYGRNGFHPGPPKDTGRIQIIRQTQTRSKGQAVCWHCGVPGHTRDICRYREPIHCHSCGRLGHKRRYCNTTD